MTGKALEVYTRLSEEDATDYQELKIYNLTEERYPDNSHVHLNIIDGHVTIPYHDIRSVQY